MIADFELGHHRKYRKISRNSPNPGDDDLLGADADPRSDQSSDLSGCRTAPGQARSARSSRSGGDGTQNQGKQTPTTSRATPPARSAARSEFTTSGVTESFMHLNA